ncbi:MAG: hypothetical protein K2M30_05645, partial [Desulfovibrionaceae bacterium]|nr:hypothetical protein [Desulfovibrionaceae bacterium]
MNINRTSNIVTQQTNNIQNTNPVDGSTTSTTGRDVRSLEESPKGFDPHVSSQVKNPMAEPETSHGFVAKGNEEPIYEGRGERTNSGSEKNIINQLRPSPLREGAQKDNFYLREHTGETGEAITSYTEKDYEDLEKGIVQSRRSLFEAPISETPEAPSVKDEVLFENELDGVTTSTVEENSPVKQDTLVFENEVTGSSHSVDEMIRDGQIKEVNIVEVGESAVAEVIIESSSGGKGEEEVLLVSVNDMYDGEGKQIEQVSDNVENEASLKMKDIEAGDT